MEIRYVIEPDDFWAYNQLVTKRITGLKVGRVLVFLMVPLIVFSELFLTGAGLAAEVGLTLTFAVIWAFLLPRLLRRSYLRAIKSQPGQTGLKTVSLGLDGLTQGSTLSESKFPWQNFIEITESASLILLFVSPRFAVIVPKRAFTGEAEANVFLELARGYRDHAVFGKPLPPEPQNEQWPPPPQSLAR